MPLDAIVERTKKYQSKPKITYKMIEELKQPRKHPPKEKVEAIKDALKYFEVI